MNRRVEHRVLAIALLASLVLWNLPFGGLLLYPFKLIGTWIHELSHGLLMIATGAGFDHMYVYRDTSGLAYPRDNVGALGSALIAAAGYMGTPLWGALLLATARTARAARIALLVLATALGITALAVLANAFGAWALGACALGFATVAAVVPPRGRVIVVQFVGAQMCIDAVLDVRVLFRPSQVVDGVVARTSDAHNMARLTLGTTDDWAVWLWVSAWLVWALLVLYVALRLGQRGAIEPTSAASSAGIARAR